ncbi:hypothetical protein IAE22_31960, partial [Bacillus sp. S34]|nr:hypothetical protein [Bacillus sp. S34]
GEDGPPVRGEPVVTRAGQDVEHGGRHGRRRNGVDDRPGLGGVPADDVAAALAVVAQGEDPLLLDHPEVMYGILTALVAVGVLVVGVELGDAPTISLELGGP